MNAVVPVIKPVVDATPCGFKFATFAPCGVPEDHAIHHDRWRGPEANHDYIRNDRRRGSDRRAGR